MAKLAVLSLMASGAAAQYSLSATYTGQTFFDNFDFFTVSLESCFGWCMLIVTGFRRGFRQVGRSLQDRGKS